MRYVPARAIVATMVDSPMRLSRAGLGPVMIGVAEGTS